MSSKETMWIAFPNGGIIPASITGEKDRAVDAHDPVKVPSEYGQHLVHDRFAYEAEAPNRKGKAGKGGKSAVDSVTLKLADLQAQKAAATTDEDRARIDGEIAALAQANPDLFAQG